MHDWQTERRDKLADLTVGAHVIAYLITIAVVIMHDPKIFSFDSYLSIFLGILMPAGLFIVSDYYFSQHIKSERVLLAWNLVKIAGLFAIMTFVFLGYHEGNIGLLGGLYLLPVVLSCITMGRNWGFIFAAAATAGLLLVNQQAVANTFETALVNCGVFFLAAWFLGGISDIEQQTSGHLAELASTDGLTGLANHRYFQDKFQKEVSRAQALSQTISLLFLDIDYFKQYNDTYGHTQGDLILKELAALLKEKMPEKGFLARYGGEEYVLLLPETGLEEAGNVAEQLRQAVLDHKFPGESSQPYKKLTVSIGVANLPYHASNKLELLEAADEALYSSKFTGRNKVRTYLALLERMSQTTHGSEKELINSLRTLMTLINAKDRYTYGHSERVAFYTRCIGKKLGLPEEDMRLLEYGAFLHDVGKLEIPREVLNKTGPLSEGEWQTMQQHPLLGAEILKPIQSLQPVLSMVLHHHENFDGSGYPQNLQGKEIPLYARILRLADSYDAMTTSRPYRSPYNKSEAIRELSRCAGYQYDPHLVRIFIKILQEEIDSVI